MRLDDADAVIDANSGLHDFRKVENRELTESLQMKRAFGYLDEGKARMKILFNSVYSILLAGLVFFVFFLIGALAQSKPPSASNRSSNLSDQEERGKGLFLQNCSLCHLPPPENKPNMRQSSGLVLNGLFKNSKLKKEKAVREIILKGSPNMPGFQYSLKSNEIDDLIAFLKTLDDLNSYLNEL